MDSSGPFDDTTGRAPSDSQGYTDDDKDFKTKVDNAGKLAVSPMFDGYNDAYNLKDIVHVRAMLKVYVYKHIECATNHDTVRLDLAHREKEIANLQAEKAELLLRFQREASQARKDRTDLHKATNEIVLKDHTIEEKNSEISNLRAKVHGLQKPTNDMYTKLLEAEGEDIAKAKIILAKDYEIAGLISSLTTYADKVDDLEKELGVTAVR
jgi:chromosome segregation ATPase